MIERVNGGIRLGEYFKKHIFEPLGMTSTGFRPSENESIRENLSATTARTPTGELVGANAFPPANPKDDLGGGGLYTAPKDYIKVLIALLKNEGTLLKRETVDMMFAPQLPDSKYLEAVVNSQNGAMYRSGVDSKLWNFGFGGILNMEDVEGVCKQGTMTWGGLPNLFWVCSILCLYLRLTPILTASSGLTALLEPVACMPLNSFHQATLPRCKLL